MNTRRTVDGNFRALELEASAWRLTTGMAGGSEVYIVGAEPSAGEILRASSPRAIEVVWQPAGATVRLISAADSRSVQARTVIIHEPRGSLYDGLPLMKLDARGRRFWRLVFLLVRIPGGRRLLGFLARRAGG